MRGVGRCIVPEVLFLQYGVLPVGLRLAEDRQNAHVQLGTKSGL